MYCSVCGAANAVGAQSCVKCGARLSGRCWLCEAELPPGARFCPNCGGAADGAMPSGENTGGDTWHYARSIRTPTPERKQVTVLFGDFSGFTAFSHELDAEEVHDQMNAAWSRLDGIISSHGGTVEKHIGDAIMGLFGSRVAREEDPAEAVRAALAMQASLAQAQSSTETPPLQLRIGIHTGPVLLGPVGTTGEFSAMGDTVNLASRLEHNAPPGGIIISQETYRQVYGLFDVQPLPPVLIKGKPEPIQIYLVLRVKARSVAAQLRGIEGIHIDMVGRQAELARLQSALQEVIAQRHLQMATIVGEAGIGKSCLSRKFQEWMELLPQSFRVFIGRAAPGTAGLPFSLIRETLSARFEILESDPTAVAREKLERGIAALLAHGQDQNAPSPDEACRLAHFIGQLLGFDFSASPYLREILNDSEQIRQRAFQALSTFFTRISQPGGGRGEKPIINGAILLFDDIHWADDGSLDLLSHLATACQDAPVMLIGLARPTLFERRPDWRQLAGVHLQLKLEPLTREQSTLLLEKILKKAEHTPESLREMIIGSAEGNPFYIEEIVKMLIDQKVIVPGDPHWRIEPERLASARVPATLTGVLQARLDGLKPLERAVLQRASVIGRIFWDSAVEQLSSEPEALENTSSGVRPSSGAASSEASDAAAKPTAAELSELAAPEDGRTPLIRSRPEGPLSKSWLEEALAGLRQKELIFRRESSVFAGAVEYVFNHELLRNVTYESVLKKMRRDHHAKVAEWLIERSGERVGDSAALVASHFDSAGQPRRAAEWYARAGQHARVSYSPATAIEHFRKALQLLPKKGATVQAKRLECHEGLCETLGARARFSEAIESCLEMRQLAETLGDQAAQARAWNNLAFINERRGDNRASVQAAETAETIARGAGPTADRERIRALHLKGWAFYRLGDAEAVRALAEQTLTLCSELGDRRGMAISHKLHGVANLQLGRFVEADGYFKQGLALFDELGDRRNAGAMWSNLGESARLRGDYQAAAELYSKALTIVRGIGSCESEIIYLSNLSGARLGLGQFAEAEADLRQVMRLINAGNSCALSETFAFLAQACLGQGRLEEAREAAQQALNLARQSENDLDLGGAWRVLGMATAKILQAKQQGPGSRTDGTEDPATCFRHSLAIFEKMNAHGEQARTLRLWGEFELQQGQRDAGLEKMRQAQELFNRLDMPLEVARVQETQMASVGQ